MIDPVRGAIFDSICVGSIVQVTGSTSTNTGVAPVYLIAETVAINDIDTVITSSPGPIPAASSATCSALVPVFTATAYFTLCLAANSSSNATTSGPST